MKEPKGRRGYISSITSGGPQDVRAPVGGKSGRKGHVRITGTDLRGGAKGGK